MELGSAIELLRRDPAHWLAFSADTRLLLKQEARLQEFNDELHAENGTFLPSTMG